MDWNAMIGLGAYHGSIPVWDGCLPWRWGCRPGVRRRCGVRCRPSRSAMRSQSAVVALFAGAGIVLPFDVVKAVMAATLVTLGIYRLWRHRHPRFGGMQVGFAI
jgi:hypothetical protein